MRWTPNRKAIVVRAVRGGLIPLQEALDRYGMKEHEFLMWEEGLSDVKTGGLNLTHYQRRQKAKRDVPV